MLYEAADGFLSGEKTGGIFHYRTQKNGKHPQNYAFPTQERKLYCWNRRSTQNIFLLNYFFEPGNAKAPRLFSAPPCGMLA